MSVSEVAALDLYGVVLVDNAVDEAATLARRADIPQSEKMFHRGQHYDAEEDRVDA